MLATAISPPITPASSRLMVSPSPVPVWRWRDAEPAALERREDALEVFGAMPMPVSATTISATGLR